MFVAISFVSFFICANSKSSTQTEYDALLSQIEQEKKDIAANTKSQSDNLAKLQAEKKSP